MNQTETVPDDERDMTALILQNRRLVNLLATVLQKQLIRHQHQRLQDAVAASLLRDSIDEELKRSGMLLSKIDTV